MRLVSSSFIKIEASKATVIEIETQDRSNATIDFGGEQGMEKMGVNFRAIFGNLFPSKTVRRKLKISEAKDFMLRQKRENLTDSEQIKRRAVRKPENSGIIFLDEIDRIAGRESGSGGPEVSPDGVRRASLPIVEGTTINSRYGMVNTEHILFAAAGAFHVFKTSDLIPELQGRFPIRGELTSATLGEFKQTLIQSKNSLIKQHQALLNVGGVNLEFTGAAISTLAATTVAVSQTAQNIGARRLNPLPEKLLKEITFLDGEIEETHQNITDACVRQRLAGLVEDQNFRHYNL